MKISIYMILELCIENFNGNNAFVIYNRVIPCCLRILIFYRRMKSRRVGSTTFIIQKYVSQIQNSIIIHEERSYELIIIDGSYYYYDTSEDDESFDM
jgi:hypothetical protein